MGVKNALPTRPVVCCDLNLSTSGATSLTRVARHCIAEFIVAGGSGQPLENTAYWALDLRGFASLVWKSLMTVKRFEAQYFGGTSFLERTEAQAR